MRNTIKLKRLLKSNVVGISFSDYEWHLSLIHANSNRRNQFSGNSFSETINKAYRFYFSAKKEESTLMLQRITERTSE